MILFLQIMKYFCGSIFVFLAKYPSSFFYLFSLWPKLHDGTAISSRFFSSLEFLKQTDKQFATFEISRLLTFLFSTLYSKLPVVQFTWILQIKFHTKVQLFFQETCRILCLNLKLNKLYSFLLHVIDFFGVKIKQFSSQVK